MRKCRNNTISSWKINFYFAADGRKKNLEAGCIINDDSVTWLVINLLNDPMIGMDCLWIAVELLQMAVPLYVSLIASIKASIVSRYFLNDVFYQNNFIWDNTSRQKQGYYRIWNRVLKCVLHHENCAYSPISSVASQY